MTIRMLSQLNTLAVILTLVIHQVLVEGQCVPKGTTPDIRELVLGRCVDYQTNINPGPFCVNGVSNHRNCTALADKFTSAFAFQPGCNVSYSRYDDFLKAAEIDVPPGQSMFWSGVYGVVQMYSNRGQRATVLEDTLIGYMVDGLQFCAQTDPPGITYGADCPGFDQTANCTNNAEFSFWAMASKHYASHASGEAHVMLNASRDQPFRDSSFFATWEVPNMNASQLSKVNILMVHIPGQRIRSTCNSNNISGLKKRLRDRNIASSCQDSPRGPQTMLCVDYPGERECDIDRTTSASSRLVSVGVHITVLNAALKSISL
ncbi:ADP-ribosyl cyclase/cyclic ADP-ribose hydrolase-like [Haliotis cracherodii]|uniref:ADP-ribosyl cyclase/cyclic ADP-ribose hydrolase-like n=1 Tax=Haliotis cracherodii TaxID=6455 RepID=UPI0039E74663